MDLLSIKDGFVFRPYGCDTEMRFTSFQEVKDWVERERVSWGIISSFIDDGRIGLYFQIQRQHHDLLLQLVSNVIEIEAEWTPLNMKKISEALHSFETGETLTTRHPVYSLVEPIFSTDPEAAALCVIAASFPRQTQHLKIDSHELALASVRIALLTRKFPDDAIAAARHRVMELETEVVKLMGETADQLINSRNGMEHIKAKDEIERIGRESRWDELASRMANDFAGIKATVVTEAKIAAPSEFWTARARSCCWQAIGFGALFVLLAAALLWAFENYAVSRFISESGNNPNVAAFIPLVVPAFLGLWLLRIVGRLLADNLSLMRDASERRTMVSTFFALMNNRSEGDLLITDADRVLMLHAIFRQSSGNKGDDAPPLTLLEALLAKVADTKRP